MTDLDLPQIAHQYLDGITPGPWNVIEVNGQLVIANTSDKFLVAVLHPDDTTTEPGPSNARFLAAAPDLVHGLLVENQLLRDLAADQTRYNDLLARSARQLRQSVQKAQRLSDKLRSSVHDTVAPSWVSRLLDEALGDSR